MNSLSYIFVIFVPRGRHSAKIAEHAHSLCLHQGLNQGLFSVAFGGRKRDPENEVDEYEFYLHVHFHANQTHFHRLNSLHTKTRFETEARDNLKSIFVSSYFMGRIGRDCIGSF